MTDSEISIEEIIKLPGMEDVKDELEDPRYANRQHGTRATAALHCTGPLCKKAARDRQRRRNQEEARRKGKPYQPSIHRLYDRDELLESIIAWHKRDLALRRAEAS